MILNSLAIDPSVFGKILYREIQTTFSFNGVKFEIQFLIRYAGGQQAVFIEAPVADLPVDHRYLLSQSIT